jgi:hypothetical protein
MVVCPAVQDMSDADEVKPAATATMAALKRSAKCGPRRTVSPSKHHHQQQRSSYSSGQSSCSSREMHEDLGGRKQL